MIKAFSAIDRFIKPSLRFKVASGFVAPIFLLVLFLAYSHYLRERDVLQQQVEISAAQLGDIVLSSLDHSMLQNDQVSLATILQDIGRQGGLQRVWIIDINGEVKKSSVPGEVGQKFDVNMPGCVECHRQPQGSLPTVIEMPGQAGQFRIARPIDNALACQACHPASQPHIGVLMIDESKADIEQQLTQNLRNNLILTFLVALFAMLVVFVLINWLVVRRVEVLHRALSAFEKGDYSARIQRTWVTEDELTQLAVSFNNMADSITRHQKEQRELTQVRQKAILDERERIARELHDGVAQFIGYVNTKVMAIRILLQTGQIGPADRQLAQIEQAVHDQSIDVRASIIGLRLATDSGAGLVVSLVEFVKQCNRLNDYPIDLEIVHPVEDLRLNAETELQLLRIVQESLSNVRKHASAKHAFVTVTLENDLLMLVIQDDGIGFIPGDWSATLQPRFGLQTMRERAEAVGAEFSLASEPGHGTTVTIRLNVKET